MKRQEKPSIVTIIKFWGNGSQVGDLIKNNGGRLFSVGNDFLTFADYNSEQEQKLCEGEYLVVYANEEFAVLSSEQLHSRFESVGVMTTELIEKMIRELISEVDYDIGKDFDPETSEEPEEIEERMAVLVGVVKKYL